MYSEGVCFRGPALTCPNGPGHPCGGLSSQTSFSVGCVGITQVVTPAFPTRPTGTSQPGLVLTGVFCPDSK